MTHSPTSQMHSPPAHPAERPKGILKNKSGAKSPPSAPQEPAERPELGREMSEKEVVLQNTLQNMGHRRSSSNPHGPPSRRQSGATPPALADDNSPRLKWDEANLYLTEQDRGDKMKITEPKTPYAGQYDPAEDEDEIAAINANEVVVDELDKAKVGKINKEDDIPGLDLGESEMDASVQLADGDKRVYVDPTADAADKDEGYHGELPDHMPKEELEKHRKFEEARKKHYEMKNVKNLLGHSEDIMDEDDDEDDKPRVPPPVPTIPAGIANGQR